MHVFNNLNSRPDLTLHFIGMDIKKLIGFLGGINIKIKKNNKKKKKKKKGKVGGGAKSKRGEVKRNQRVGAHVFADHSSTSLSLTPPFLFFPQKP